MKILLSPSKTQKIAHRFDVPLHAPLFTKQTSVLLDTIQSLNDEAVVQKLHIPKTHVQDVLKYYRFFGQEEGSAFESYTGEAFKYLKDQLRQEDLENAQQRLYIFSALYGLLRPFDRIHPYRLDMTMSLLENQSLTLFWKAEINALLKQEKEILSLASQEFEKVLTVPYKKVAFCNSDGKRVHTVLAKQMRGMMAGHIIQKNYLKIEDVKTIQLNGFYFQEEKNDTLFFHKEG